VVGVAEDPARIALERVARAATSPGLVVVTGEPPSGEPHLIPLLEGRGLVGGRAAAYVCRAMVCERPVTGPEELRALLRA
jgi:uncharacterized protein